jgi:hypothetical protein
MNYLCTAIDALHDRERRIFEARRLSDDGNRHGDIPTHWATVRFAPTAVLQET